MSTYNKRVYRLKKENEQLKTTSRLSSSPKLNENRVPLIKIFRSSVKDKAARFDSLTELDSQLYSKHFLKNTDKYCFDRVIAIKLDGAYQ